MNHENVASQHGALSARDAGMARTLARGPSFILFSSAN